jgi:hypothetical protein
MAKGKKGSAGASFKAKKKGSKILKKKLAKGKKKKKITLMLFIPPQVKFVMKSMR